MRTDAFTLRICRRRRPYARDTPDGPALPPPFVDPPSARFDRDAVGFRFKEFCFRYVYRAGTSSHPFA